MIFSGFGCNGYFIFEGCTIDDHERFSALHIWSKISIPFRGKFTKAFFQIVLMTKTILEATLFKFASENFFVLMIIDDQLQQKSWKRRDPQLWAVNNIHAIVDCLLFNFWTFGTVFYSSFNLIKVRIFTIFPVFYSIQSFIWNSLLLQSLRY